jgi:hypothetical protein
MKFPQIGEARMEDQIAFPLIRPVFAVGGNMPAIEEGIG